jgi:hypothetical protein
VTAIDAMALRKGAALCCLVQRLSVKQFCFSNFIPNANPLFIPNVCRRLVRQSMRMAFAPR